MCGINGILKSDNVLPERKTLIAMNEAILHRGPDAGNIEILGNIGLGHRRLSIIDLSSYADQPMFNDKRNLAIS